MTLVCLCVAEYPTPFHSSLLVEFSVSLCFDNLIFMERETISLCISVPFKIFKQIIHMRKFANLLGKLVDGAWVDCHLLYFRKNFLPIQAHILA